ncbi:MAG: flagellar protein FlaG [Thermodesulfobacteriota bacterium]|nr:flagellar protein FlaG [Thermodesulfobacteriota bacterium]
MDITIDRIDAEPLKISEYPVNKPVVSGNPRAEEDHGKTSEHEISGSVSNQQARELVEKLQGYIDRMNINMAFSTYGEKSKKTAITVSEKETGKLIREIPPEELQRLHVKMEELVGMLFNGMV